MNNNSLVATNEECWLLWEDHESRIPEFNIAIDELLLSQATTTSLPILRVFSWSCLCASFGRSQVYPIELESKYYLLRRKTGGGIVFHDDDLNYSLIFPTAHPILNMNRLESYRIIHESIQRELANPSRITNQGCVDVDRSKMRCFDSPSKFDLLDTNGKKIAGAAQRRTRQGLIHQGSVKLSATNGKIDVLRNAIVNAIAKCFNIGYSNWQPNAQTIKLADDAVKNCYQTKEWNRYIKCPNQLNN